MFVCSGKLFGNYIRGGAVVNIVWRGKRVWGGGGDAGNGHKVKKKGEKIQWCVCVSVSLGNSTGTPPRIHRSYIKRRRAFPGVCGYG